MYMLVVLPFKNLSHSHKGVSYKSEDILKKDYQVSRCKHLYPMAHSLGDLRVHVLSGWWVRLVSFRF